MDRMHVVGTLRYGNPVDWDDEFADLDDRFDYSVEVPADDWDPITGESDGLPVVAFVDGVPNVDVHLSIEDPEAGPIAGMCASYAVGAVLWRRDGPQSEVVSPTVERVRILGDGREAPVLHASPQLQYRCESVGEVGAGALRKRLYECMRRAEAELALELTRSGFFVVGDGPLYTLAESVDAPAERIGYVKSHRVPYLDARLLPVVPSLRAGQRTPLFEILGPFPKYTWYQRLLDGVDVDPWYTIIRCEVARGVGLERAAVIADRLAAELPFFASEPHKEPRPANLVPVATLEDRLRQHLGDARLIETFVRTAITEERAAA